MPLPVLINDILFVMATDHEYGPALQRLIAPLIVGVGPIESAIGTALSLQALVDAGQRPRLVVCLGSAGSRRCATGTIWQVSSVSWRDMDATRLGFEKGVTPFADHPATIGLPTPIAGLPAASLSSGGGVIGGSDYDAIPTDLVDMETFAVVRAAQRFGVPVIGLRGVSDGVGELRGIEGWTALLGVLDGLLAVVVERIIAISGTAEARSDILAALRSIDLSHPAAAP